MRISTVDRAKGYSAGNTLRLPTPRKNTRQASLSSRRPNSYDSAGACPIFCLDAVLEAAADKAGDGASMCRDEALAEEDELRAEGASEGIVAREASEAETQPVSLSSAVHSRHIRESYYYFRNGSRTLSGQTHLSVVGVVIRAHEIGGAALFGRTCCAAHHRVRRPGKTGTGEKVYKALMRR